MARGKNYLPVFIPNGWRFNFAKQSKVKNAYTYILITEETPDIIQVCLIAYACRMSFILGSGDYKGWLAFDVQEEFKEDEKKLMTLYSSKYKAQRLGDVTIMLIQPRDGEKLIEKYLKPLCGMPYKIIVSPRARSDYFNMTYTLWADKRNPIFLTSQTPS